MKSSAFSGLKCRRIVSSSSSTVVHHGRSRTLGASLAKLSRKLRGELCSNPQGLEQVTHFVLEPPVVKIDWILRT